MANRHANTTEASQKKNTREGGRLAASEGVRKVSNKWAVVGLFQGWYGVSTGQRNRRSEERMASKGKKMQMGFCGLAK